MDKQRVIGLILALALCLLGALPAAGEGPEPARRAREALTKLGGFDATYDAQSASGRSYTIHVRFQPPDKMRVDVEPLGILTLFDGNRYLYYDDEQKRAISFSIDAVQKELLDQERRLNAISWAGLPVPSATDEPIYPSFVLGLSPDNLDIAVEMAPQPNQHSWIREMTIADPIAVKGNQAEFPTRASRGRVRLTVDLQTGLLAKAEIGDPDDVVGTIRLKELKKGAPDGKAFVYVLPSTLEVRDQKSDPSLLQQLLVSAFRSHLDRLLDAAKAKWPTLTAAQKKELDQAVYAAFGHIFTLGQASAKQGVQQSLRGSQFNKMIQDALRNDEAKQKFTADHPELSDEALAAAWRKQVQAESAQAVLLEVVRAIDDQFVAPLRQQALDATAGMAEGPRKELLQSSTEPVFRAYLEMIRPIVEETVGDLLK
ncbi:MAG: hypothetical protein GX444_09115 [Myxococcales bacterium]|nr:hypothetical protein [Myxococcales bacterium]